jgi:hypothetical protein
MPKHMRAYPTNNGLRIQSSTEVKENSSFFSPVLQVLSVQPLFRNSSAQATRYLV